MVTWRRMRRRDVDDEDDEEEDDLDGGATRGGGVDANGEGGLLVKGNVGIGVDGLEVDGLGEGGRPVELDVEVAPGEGNLIGLEADHLEGLNTTDNHAVSAGRVRRGGERRSGGG